MPPAVERGLRAAGDQCGCPGGSSAPGGLSSGHFHVYVYVVASSISNLFQWRWWRGTVAEQGRCRHHSRETRDDALVCGGIRGSHASYW